MRVTEQCLHGVQARAAFDEVRGEGMTQRVHGGVRQVEFLARDEHETLQGTHRHRCRGVVHADAELRAIIVATTNVRKEQQRMPMESPVAAQVFEHVRRQRHDAVFAAFAMPHTQLLLAADDVVDRQTEALTEAQPAAVDELQRDAVAPQPDVVEQRVDLLAREHQWQLVMILRSHIGKHRPVGVAEHLDKEQARGSGGLAHRLGPPAFDHLHMDEVVGDLCLSQHRRITREVLMEQAHVAVVGMPRARRMRAKRQQSGEVGHRRPRVSVGRRIAIRTSRIDTHPGMKAPDIAPLGARRSRRRLGRKGGWRQRGGSIFRLVHGAAIS